MSEDISRAFRKIWEGGLQKAMERQTDSMTTEIQAVLRTLADMDAYMRETQQEQQSAMAELHKNITDQAIEMNHALQLLQECQSISCALQQSASFADATGTTASQWYQLWVDRFNMAFQQGKTPTEVETNIENQIRQQLLWYRRIDFQYLSEYQRDSTYSVFSEQKRGRCILLQSPQAPQQYAAFPCPNSDVWFLKGRDLFTQLYQMEGLTSEEAAPRLVIEEVALVEQMDESTDGINGEKMIRYKPLRKGLLRVTV